MCQTLPQAASHRTGSFDRCLALWLPDRHRCERVLVLLGTIVVLSVVDLALTVFHMRSTGMYEANPLVRAIVDATHSAEAVALLKVLSVSIGVGLLYGARRHRQAEMAAWLGTAVLTALTVLWIVYVCVNNNAEAGTLFEHSFVRLD